MSSEDSYVVNDAIYEGNFIYRPIIQTKPVIAILVPKLVAVATSLKPQN